MEAGSRKILFFSMPITLLIIAIVYSSFDTGRDIAVRYSPLVDATMEIKLEAIAAHLWFEEAISGDRTVDIEDIWAHLDQSEGYAQAMLDGGSNEKGTFLALNDPNLRRQIKATIVTLQKFRQIAQQRWHAQSTSAISSEIEHQFDQTFVEFNLATDDVQRALQKKIIKDLQTFNFMEQLLLALILILGIVISGVLLRYNTKINKIIVALHAQKESLRITLNSIGDAVIITDTHGVVTYLNPIAIQLTGWASAQAIGQPLADVFNIVHAHTREPANNPIKNILETGLVLGLAKHAILIAKDGSEYRIADSGGPIGYATGDINSIVLVFRDVTHQYAQNVALASSQGLLKIVLNTVPDLIWLKNTKGVFLTCNAKFERFFGAQEREIVGKTDYHFVDKALADLFRKNDQKALMTGKATTNEELLTFADDGHSELVETIKTPMTDSHGNLIGILGVSRDISRYKESLTQFKESESRLKEAQALAKIGSWGQKFENETLFWSDEVYRIFEYAKNPTITHEQFVERVHPDDRSKIAASFQSSLKKRTSYHLKYRLLFPDGRIKYIMSLAEHFYDHNNKHIRSLGTIQDITKNKEAEQRLIASEARFKALMQQSPAAIELYNTDGFMTDMNDAAKKIWDIQESPLYKFNVFTSEEVKKKGHLKYLNKAYRGEVVEMDPFEFNPSGKTERGEGRKRWVKTTIYPLKDAQDIVQSIVVSHLDITEQIHAEEKRQLSSRVFSDAHEGIIITDPNQLIVDVNPAFSQITGYSREDIIGKTPSILNSGKQSPQFYTALWQDVNVYGYWQGEVWNRKKQGELYAELLTISSLKNEYDEVTHYVGMFSDITSSKQQQDQLTMMAHYDVLTNLPNRALFVNHFNQSIAHSTRTGYQFVVCCLDVDNFKPVNDNYGHEAGDRLLIEVADRIRSCIRKEDTVSRQGGDEFAILLNDIESASQYEGTIKRLHQALALPYFIDDVQHNVTASSGVTIYPADDGDIDTLLRHADQAMYQSKLAGKDRSQLYSPDSDQRIIQQNHQLEEIEQALIKHEFQLYYQPKVNMVNGDVFGVEALIRWIHPEKGLIPPLDFLPFIDGTPLEIRIGEWVINEALQQLDNWQQQGIKLEVSVNISSNHLLSRSFVLDLENSLAAYSLNNAQYLQLEILESSAFGDINTINDIVEICQNRLGVSFALDDFGTGYSSLTHLRSLPVNTIKIDQSFVRDMLDDPSDYAIIEGVIALTKSFDRNVIAEGVETTTHGLMLLLMGCEQAQGYAIAKPMPAAVFSQWLSKYIANEKWLLCANKQRNKKENSLEILRMASHQWIDKFKSKILSSPSAEIFGPILNNKLCQCGNWIRREKQEKLCSKVGLQRLEKAHDKMHIIAHDIEHKYQQGDIETARAALADLALAFDEMNNARGCIDLSSANFVQSKRLLSKVREAKHRNPM